MNLMMLSLGLAAAAPAPAPATAEAGAETRTLAFELREGEQVVATPSLTVELGRPASVAMRGFGLSFVVDRAGEHYFLSSGLYRMSARGWTLVAHPSLTVDEGAPARVSFTAGDGSALSMAVEIR